jgi:hypothetical protein
MRRNRNLLCVVSTAIAFACSNSSVISDAGLPDAAEGEDASIRDSGGPDAGNLDAGEVDSGTADAGLDAGTDAGNPDGGAVTALLIRTTSLPPAQQGTAYSFALTATGGITPYTWSETGTLPGGLTVTPAGRISGTPTQPGSFPLIVSVTDSSAPPLNASQPLTLIVIPSTGAGTRYYVSPTGSDGNPGTISQPWGTLSHAQAVVQGLAKTNPITIYLRAGTYSVPTGLSFASIDSGGSASAPIIWAAYPGEVPVVSGAVAVAGWTNPSGNLWKATLPPSTLPFEYLYYNGQRRQRPRVGASPDAGNVGAFLRVASEYYAPTPSADCPDASYVADAGFKCYDRFYFANDAGVPGEPITSAWKNLNPPAGNPCGAASRGTGVPPGDVEVDLFEAWTMEKMRVSCVDDANQVLYFTADTPIVPSQIPFFGPTKGHRFIVENVQDLLTEPGQWFVDRSSTPWVLSYLANPGENPTTDLVEIPQAQPVFAANGLSWVVFQGITFEMDDYVPPSSGFNQDQNGENYLPAALDCESCENVLFDGITVRHTSANGIQVATEAKSTIAASNVTVQNSAFYDNGSCGIHLGHQPDGADTDAILPKDLVVQNNIIQGYSRVFADGEGIATGSVQDTQLIHNDITDGYHAGISVCTLGCPAAASSRGAANVASLYNRIWNILQGITSDGGSLYYNIGTATRTALGGLIQHNVIHDVTDSSIIDQGVKGSAYGGHGIYLDIQTGGVTIQDNVVYRVSVSSLFQGQGPGPNQPANLIANNIFAYARSGMFSESTPWPQGCPTSSPLRASLLSNLFYFDRTEANGFYPILGCAYSCGFPFNQFQNFQSNLYWRADGTFPADTKQFHVESATPKDPSTCGGAPSDWAFMQLPKWQTSITVGGQLLPMDEDPGAVIADPGFANPAYPNDDYSLSSSPVTGFDYTATNDTVQNAGRNNPVIMPPAVPATFPTYTYDPASAF